MAAAPNFESYIVDVLAKHVAAHPSKSLTADLMAIYIAEQKDYQEAEVIRFKDWTNGYPAKLWQCDPKTKKDQDDLLMSMSWGEKRRWYFSQPCVDGQTAFVQRQR